MLFQHIPIHPLLKGHIEKLWIFESAGRALSDDIKLIVPNGRVKIAVPYNNGIIAGMQNWTHFTKENSVTLIGLFDAPSTMDIAEDKPSGTICAELSPHAAYRFFKMQWREMANSIYSLSDILGKSATLLEEQICNAITKEEKADIFQQFLLEQFLRTKEDSIFEYCVEKIKSSEGKITVRELEKKTGYSSRWLNMKFIEKLGLSPKNFASVIRFKNYYEILCSDKDDKYKLKNFYHYYYDQSHFIKDFKRFTGLTPNMLEQQMNEFGRIFYNV